MNREQSIQNLIAQGLSGPLAESCVDSAGNVDTARVDTLKAGMSWGRNPASAANPQVVANLVEELKVATQSRNVNAMMRIRSALAKHGVYNPEI